MRSMLPTSLLIAGLLLARPSLAADVTGDEDSIAGALDLSGTPTTFTAVRAGSD